MAMKTFTFFMMVIFRKLKLALLLFLF
jgi:hypothetical protein